MSDLEARAQKLREELPDTDIDILVSSYPVEVLNVSSFMVRCPGIPRPQALNHRLTTFEVVPIDPFCNSGVACRMLSMKPGGWCHLWISLTRWPTIQHRYSASKKEML